MNRFKYHAYLQEFPFLQDLMENENPDSVRVKRADENLLKFIPTYSLHVGSLGRTEVDEKVHFVLSDSEVLHNAVVRSEEYSSNYSGDTPYSEEGETVLEAIDRHGVAESLVFIVVEKYYLDDWSGQEREEEYTIEIYKTPKHTSYAELIRKAQEKALAEVRAEADF